MFAKDFRARAWQKLTGNWGIMLLVCLLYSIFITLLSYTFVGTLILGGPLMIGLVSAVLALVRTGNSRVELLFDGFKDNISNSIVAYLLYTVYLIGWSLLFVIPGIVKSYSYAMTFYVLRDNPSLTPTEAITRSREMMNGNKWRLFCLHFSFIGWILLSLVTCGIGLLFVMPYMQVAQAEFYESIKGDEAIPEINMFNV